MKKKGNIENYWNIREPEAFMLFNQLMFYAPITLIVFLISKQTYTAVFLYIVFTLSNLREYHRNKKEQRFYEEQSMC